MAGRERGNNPGKERIVILGSGWAGYGVARSLSATQCSRVLVSPRSHFVFTPLLASTTVGTIEFRAALESARSLGLDEIHLAWASDIDFEAKKVRVQASTRDELATRTDKLQARGTEFDVPYDKLVLALGCYSQTFGIEGVKEHACFLKDAGDARKIRLQVLQAFEKADLPTTSVDAKKKLLHFAVVGGGPTGIEFAAELHDLVHEDLARVYPGLMEHITITIYDVAPKVLSMFDQKLAAYATNHFQRQGITIKTEHHLERIRREGDTLMLQVREEPAEVGAGLVVWSTGLAPNPLVRRITSREVGGSIGRWRIATNGRTGGIVTDGRLRVLLMASGNEKDKAQGTRVLPDVFALGDCAKVQGQNLPATAQVANQQAAYLAKQLNRGDEDEKEAAAPSFRFRSLGMMAYLGGARAIHQSRADVLTGRLAWLLWRTAYLTKSMSLRNKVMVAVYWTMKRVFGRHIARF